MLSLIKLEDLLKGTGPSFSLGHTFGLVTESSVLCRALALNSLPSSGNTAL